MMLATPRIENNRPKPELIAIIAIKPAENKLKESRINYSKLDAG